MDCNPTVCEEKLIQDKPSRRRDLLRNKVDTIAFRFYLTIIRAIRGYISDVKLTMDV